MNLEIQIDQPRMVAYAGATWDWHRLHHDTAFAERMKVPGPVVDGQMLGALLARMVLEHFGDHAFITALSIRYKAMVFAGDTVRCEGEVTGRADGEVTVELTARAGDRIAATGIATVRVPAEEE